MNQSKKIGVIFFHKNIRSIYSERWIKKSLISMLNQKGPDFSIYEINYGEDHFSIFDLLDNDYSYIERAFVHFPMKNHAEAMNYIIDQAFSDGCDYVFNTNLDDYYSEDRLNKQLEKLESGFDVVSSDFCYIQDFNGVDTITHYKNIKSDTDIGLNLSRDHNVIAHPSVAFNKKFWSDNRYIPEEIPMEDLKLWKRAINNNFRFYITDEVLLFYRLHENQVTGNNKSI